MPNSNYNICTCVMNYSLAAVLNGWNSFFIDVVIAMVWEYKVGVFDTQTVSICQSKTIKIVTELHYMCTTYVCTAHAQMNLKLDTAFAFIYIFSP